jgi:hypothetical protein
LTLLADIPSPPKGLLESTLESVKNKIDSFSLPDNQADSKKIDKYSSELDQLCEWLADSTKGEHSGKRILECLIDMTCPVPEPLSTRFVISVMALALSYSPKGASRIAEIYNEFNCKINRIRSEEQYCRYALTDKTPSGAGYQLLFYDGMKRGGRPEYNLLDQHRAWEESKKIAAEKKTVIERDKLVRSWIRTKFRKLGESGIDVLIDNLKNCERDEDKEGYLRMLEDIGTDRALKEVERIKSKEL